ncbi:rhodanese-like domain-containing protein [Flavobacterium macrobrachii]|nr:rhodanese-like domain-containing protein [Flavobacterium macrobrachii]
MFSSKLDKNVIMRHFFLILFLFSTVIYGQKTIPEVLKKYNSERVSYINVKQASIKSPVVFLDARELIEYNTSHIKGAIHVGYNKFNQKLVLEEIKDKNTTIIVYCSIGVRSEKIGEKLLKLGYSNVFNLYGGIFEWKNNGYKVFNHSEQETEYVHTYSKEWSKYLKKGIQTY